MTYADDVLLMREGRLVCAAPPEALTQSGAIEDVFGVQLERTPAEAMRSRRCGRAERRGRFWELF